MGWLDDAVEGVSSFFGGGESGGGGFLNDIMGLIYDSDDSSFDIVHDILGNSGFMEGLTGIGAGLVGNQQAKYPYELGMAQLEWAQQKWPEQMALEREQMANQLAMAHAAAGAQVKAAEIAAGSADRRAKLAAVMDASGRRIDSANFGTSARLSAIQEMIRAAGRKY